MKSILSKGYVIFFQRKKKDAIKRRVIYKCEVRRKRKELEKKGILWVFLFLIFGDPTGEDKESHMMCANFIIISL